MKILRDEIVYGKANISQVDFNQASLEKLTWKIICIID